jgi:hypothetical protein
VNVSRNGTQLFSLPFTITASGGFTVTGELTAGAVNTNSSGCLICSAPTPKSAFLTTDGSVWVYFTYDNVLNGDVLSLNWIHPSGRVDFYQPSTTLGFNGSGCTAWSFTSRR